MKQYNIYQSHQIESMKTYYGINKKACLDFATQCEWIAFDKDSSYQITSYGENILQKFDGSTIQQDLYRDILKGYISVCKPIWAKRIPLGRKESYDFMTEEEQLCFFKSGLMNTPLSEDVVLWWDAIAEKEDLNKKNNKTKTGRKGEFLTIQYERNRTKKEPAWVSIESNLAHYDILSQVSDTDSNNILIEVKASTQSLSFAQFNITNDEWIFASEPCNISRYYIYLWLIGAPNKLAIIPYKEIVNNIPSNSGLGKWQEVSIPFIAYKNSFREI